jgi:hypothetical protein
MFLCLGNIFVHCLHSVMVGYLMEKITKLSFLESQVRTYPRTRFHSPSRKKLILLLHLQIGMERKLQTIAEKPICCPVLKGYSQTLSITAN